MRRLFARFTVRRITIAVTTMSLLFAVAAGIQAVRHRPAGVTSSVSVTKDEKTPPPLRESLAHVAGKGFLPRIERLIDFQSPGRVAEDAKASGNPARGAILFYQPYLGCASCHVGSGSEPPLGPDLAAFDKATPPAEIIESITNPSKSIRRGYEPVTIATIGGKIFSGLIVDEQPDALVLRDAMRAGERVTIRKSEIEDRKDGGPSLMPAGLVNQIGSRQDVLDLFSYVLEVAEKGPARALALRPSPSALSPPPRPDYETHLDHATMIRDPEPVSYSRGEQIYNRVCVNCHGTKDKPGSLPTSLRFASGIFKNGSDPFRMYQTLTEGYGRMAPQSWMVPEQKYDVIHYIREEYLKSHNPSQYTAVDQAYLDRLPKGSVRGPKPLIAEPWAEMDYGPSLMLTVYTTLGAEIAYKGIAVRLDPGNWGIAWGKRWAVYDHDTMQMVGAWEDSKFSDWNPVTLRWESPVRKGDLAESRFIDWIGVNFTGTHNRVPAIAGIVHLENPNAPAWADPQTGCFDDPRPPSPDGHRFGPLPRGWTRYRGTYHHGERVVISYSVGDAEVLESPGVEDDGDRAVFTRTLDIGRSGRDLALRVAPSGSAVALVGEGPSRLAEEGGFFVLKVQASDTPTRLKLLIAKGQGGGLRAFAKTSPPASPLATLTKGGPGRWKERIETRPVIGRNDGPFAIDDLTPPAINPWMAQVRPTGLDFLPDGKSLAVCTWDGDVWVVRDIDDLSGTIAWRRIASGLFQPLGLKVIGGAIYVSCRDQIAILHDLNGDGETDFYECFNSDHQVTESFHEFATGLQADAEGNFYYAKAARHGMNALVPQHGTLLKVSKDGLRTEIVATGFRAPNGVCLNPDGSVFLTDQEGNWVPKNRINRVVKGGFYGNMFGYHDVTDPSDAAMRQPLCWVTNSFDRSPAEPVWVPGDTWGPLKGSLLNLSYGTGRVFVVPFETVDGQDQGGVCEVPGSSFPTGVMRGRFHPGNGQLYLCGMSAWGSDRMQVGGVYRLRYTGRPVYLPIGLSARRGGMSITFSAPLERATATVPSRYSVSTWALRRTAEYGSEHHDVKDLAVTAVTLSDDGRTVFLDLPGIAPTWSMEITYAIRGAGGEVVEGRINNTIHKLRD